MKMRKGFTLVELLIVIVIIGILAAAMMLSSGSATASAEASNIISNLRSLKAAAVMLYADSMDDFNAGLQPKIADMARYMDNPGKVSTDVYVVEVTATNKKWYVGAKLGNYTKEVKDKLQGRKESVGLFKAPHDTVHAKGDYDGSNVVYMVAR